MLVASLSRLLDRDATLQSLGSFILGFIGFSSPGLREVPGTSLNLTLDLNRGVCQVAYLFKGVRMPNGIREMG